MGNDRSLPYHEPSITTILVQSSFLLLLNAVNKALDALIYCGLVGQVFLGMVWGTPLAGWIGRDVETATVQLGYLGLLLLVYEGESPVLWFPFIAEKESPKGGLSMSITPVLLDLPLSTAVAATGIISPIALSFLLGPISGATPLQCFAAGAALSATSLGTTFTILSTSGFSNTRLGTVLTSAAIIDDVVGLVMIQVVSSLGRNGRATTREVVGRPIGASLGLLLLVIAFCWGILKPLYPRALKQAESVRPRWLSNQSWNLMMQTTVLVALVASGSYAGTSALFVAFLAGAGCSWWDSMAAGRGADGDEELEWTGLRIYETYYKPAVERVLKPFFFVWLRLAYTAAHGFWYIMRLLTARRTGVNWILHPDNGDVCRPCPVAGDCICFSHGGGKTAHWDLAAAVYRHVTNDP